MSASKIDRRSLLASALVVGAAAALPARSAAQANRAAEIADDLGPDREQRLADAARREGAFLLYSNEPPEDNTAIIGGFERKYGIKVGLYRASSEDIRQRVLNEYRARRFDVDFMINNAPAMEALTGEKILQAVKSPHLRDLMPAALPPHRRWAGFCLNVLVA